MCVLCVLSAQVSEGLRCHDSLSPSCLGYCNDVPEPQLVPLLPTGGRPEITIDFTTPLNRAYPKQSINTEVACLVSRSEEGFVIQTRCISQGVRRIRGARGAQLLWRDECSVARQLLHCVCLPCNLHNYPHLQVPFSSAFANYVQWVAHETVSGQTRLQITGGSLRVEGSF